MKPTTQDIQHKINLKTKPLGSLGQLESIALQICNIQQTLQPSLNHPTHLVFAADHGLAQSGVSAYPPEVTAQMVLNFLQGGAAINIFCKQHDIDLKIINAGVNYDFPTHPQLIEASIGKGTANCYYQAAMSIVDVDNCFQTAATIIDEHVHPECNIIGFGEMGIGNTSSASLLMSYVCGLPLTECIGNGTGVNPEQLAHKISILTTVQGKYEPKNIKEALACYGGFEIAQMCGAMLAAYRQQKIIMIDGFIATAAFLCAYTMDPNIKSHAIFCHNSNEQGHKKMLAYLDVQSILSLNLRLGEGTGCALAYPIIKSAVHFMNEMASFESAGVSNKED